MRIDQYDHDTKPIGGEELAVTICDRITAFLKQEDFFHFHVIGRALGDVCLAHGDLLALVEACSQHAGVSMDPVILERIIEEVARQEDSTKPAGAIQEYEAMVRGPDLRVLLGALNL